MNFLIPQPDMRQIGSLIFFYEDILGIGLVWFYGISTIVGYLLPNPFYTYTRITK